MENNVTDLNEVRAANEAAAAPAPNLTARQAAEQIMAANHTSLVQHLAQAIPFRLFADKSAGGKFHVDFSDAGMQLAAEGLAIASAVPSLKPNKTDMMFVMGLFLIEQAEAQLVEVQIDHLTAQLEAMETTGALKLGPTVSPELVQMLATMQNQTSDVVDAELAKRDNGAAE